MVLQVLLNKDLLACNQQLLSKGQVANSLACIAMRHTTKKPGMIEI